MRGATAGGLALPSEPVHNGQRVPIYVYVAALSGARINPMHVSYESMQAMHWMSSGQTPILLFTSNRTDPCQNHAGSTAHLNWHCAVLQVGHDHEQQLLLSYRKRHLKRLPAYNCPPGKRPQNRILASGWASHVGGRLSG